MRAQPSRLFPVNVSSFQSMSPPNLPAESLPALALRHVDALPVGTVIDEFEIQGLLGVGGFGMVYRCYDHSLHRAVAIKEYMPTALAGRSQDHSVLVRSTADSQSFATGLQSFISEARLLARFDHPSLVKVYRFWEGNGTAYMAMPLYQGLTLKEARQLMSGPPPEAWMRDVIWSVLSALRVLHDNHTLHRDVSPDNIFLQDVGPPVLLDLGAARKAIMDHSHKHTAILKVNYAPIEQYADAKDMAEGPWTDLYALAAVMHGCLCNESPLPATFRAVRDRMPTVSQIAQTAQSHFGQSYSGEFVKALQHALTVEPDARTRSIDDFTLEMGLRAPADIMVFNWRTALGTNVASSETETTLASPRPKTDAATTIPHRREVSDRPRRHRADPQEKNRRALEPVPFSHKRSFIPYGVGAGVLMLAIAATLWARADHKSAFAAPDTPVVAGRIPAQVASAVYAPAASAPKSGTVGVQLSKPTVTPTPPTSEPAASGKPPPSTTRQAKTPELPKPSPAASSPAQVCADANMLTRTMCIYQACQRPEFAKLQVCVEDKKRWEQSNKSLTP